MPIAEITTANIDWTLVIVTCAVGALGWFLRTMHSDNRKRLDTIAAGLSPLEGIKESVSNLKDTVREHVQILPELRTDIAVMREKQTHQGGKIDTIGDEVSKLREWRHDVSNSLHKQALADDLRTLTNKQ